MLFKQLIEGQYPGATFKASGRWFSGFVYVITCPSEGNTCRPETTGGCDTTTTDFSSSYIRCMSRRIKPQSHLSLIAQPMNVKGRRMLHAEVVLLVGI